MVMLRNKDVDYESTPFSARRRDDNAMTAEQTACPAVTATAKLALRRCGREAPR
jgi:hypothetical protein